MKIFRILIGAVLIICFEEVWRFPYKPDLFLLFSIVFCLRLPASFGVMSAFAAGLAQDAAGSLDFLNTLSKTLIGAAVSVVKDKLVLEERRMFFFFLLIMSPFSVLLKAGLKILFYHEPMAWTAVFLNILAVTLLNIAVSPAFFYLIGKLSDYEQ